ncbi:glycogen synthase [bacterium BMS3Abin12]|nr:glycogen synthase [bacterium BMS3Abin12]GBE51019.1 glycogen synthase [bacterium BMS3Bbin13]HDJ86258.1 glycosyltransferase family 1 protein [Chromatiales bacterium]
MARSVKSNIGVGKKQRVWFLAESFYPPFVGGLEKHAHLLLSKLVSADMDVTVLTRKMDPTSPAHEVFKNVPIRRIPPVGILKGKGWNALVPLLSLLVRVTYLLLRHAKRYDILMVSGVRVLSIPAVLVSKVLHKPCVIRSGSPIELQEAISTESLKKMGFPGVNVLLRILRNIRNGVLRRADCLVAISEEIRQQYLDIGVDSRRIAEIPNGADPSVFHPVTEADKFRLRREFGLPDDRAIFVFTGRLARMKGVMDLVYIWDEMVRRYPKIHLLYVGSGKRSVDGCEDELKTFIRENDLEAYVTLAGEVDSVCEYLQAADVFVFPSDYEGFGSALLEAVFCGLPAIATNVGVAAQVIRDGEYGRLVAPKDPAELRSAIVWMLERRDHWKAMGAHAATAAGGEYSIDNEARRYMDLFDDLRKGAGEAS